MTLQKLNIQPKVDNAAKKKMVASNEIGVNETLQASEVNAIVNKVNEVVEAYNFGAPITAFNFKTNVPTYADLLLLTDLEVNDGFGVIADGLVYVFNGTDFPTEGNGMNLGLKPNGIVAENETLAVSGKEVYGSLKPFKDAIETEETFEVKLDSGATGVIDYASGTFSAWGQIIGKVQNFTSIYLPKFKFIQPLFPVTQIALLIRRGNFTGEVLHEQIIPFTGAINVENDVFFTFPNIPNSENSDIWVEIRTNGRLARTNAVSATAPMFLAVDPIDINVRMSSYGSNVADGVGFYIQAGTLKSKPVLSDDFLKEINSRIDANVMGEIGKRYKIAACNIRMPYVAGENFTIHNDAGHEAINVAWLATHGGDLRVGMNFTASKVITMNVTPHVSLKSAGYEVATTGGTNIHAIVFYKNGVKVPAETIALPDCSIWFYALMLVD